MGEFIIIIDAIEKIAQEITPSEQKKPIRSFSRCFLRWNLKNE